MKSILQKIIETSDLGLLPSIGVVILMLTLIAIFIRTYRPSAKEAYEKKSKLILD